MTLAQLAILFAFLCLECSTFYIDRAKMPTSRCRLSLSASEPFEEPMEEATLDDFDYATVNKVENVINHEIGIIASVAAIQTASNYMNEFRDDVTQNWMVSFNEYKLHGFDDEHSWQSFIEKMIELDAFELNVLYKPPKALRTKSSRPGAKNVMLQYAYEIQPRKVAHQLVTVRENICSELIDDIRSVKVENKEARLFAQHVLNYDRIYAENHRHTTRGSDLGGSTPLRNQNYNSAAVMITNLALDLVKVKFLEKGDTVTVKCLDDLLAKLEADVNALDVNERHIRQRLYASGPRALIEELYYMGIVKGIDRETGANCMMLAEEVLSTRLALAAITIRTLESQTSEARGYYKTIKDKGGFAKFRLKNEKMTIVDLDVLDAQEAAAAVEAEAAEKVAQELKVKEEKAQLILDAKEKAKKELGIGEATTTGTDTPDSGSSDDDDDLWGGGGGGGGEFGGFGPVSF